jgi:hypothetical protein
MQLRYGHARGVVSCAQMAEIPGYGGCPAGAVTAAFPASLFRNLYLSGYHVNLTLAKVTWPAANVTAAQLATLPLDSLNVATNGSTSAIEQARTVLDQAYPFLQAPKTRYQPITLFALSAWGWRRRE